MSITLFYVYVIELRGLPYRAAYVGSSAKPPRERLRAHKRGGLGTSRWVRRYGARLLPAAYAGENPCPTRQDARRKERAIARRLEARCVHVFGACKPSRSKCRLEKGS